MYINLEIFLLFIVGFRTLCHSKVIINLRIYNYQNENDIKHDGWKCESFHWLNDYCDPMFNICVTSQNKCDVLNLTIDHWKNKKYVYTVLSRTIIMEQIQKSFIIEVKIDDHDKVDGHDHIAMFNLPLQITQLNQNYAAPMIVRPRGIDVRLSASITMRCAENYYGENCNQFCKPKLFNYNCNSLNGEKICSIYCGLYGVCDWKEKSDQFECHCIKGWIGDQCQFSNFENCTTLTCNKKCNNSRGIRYCFCMNGTFVQMCQDPIKSTSTKIILTTKRLTTKISTTQKSTIIISTKKQSFITTSKAFNNTQEIIKEVSKSFQKYISTQSTAEKSQQNQKWPAIIENGFSATTAIIICLLLLLCICVISLSIVIRNWKRKEISKTNGLFPTFYSQRPLPPVTYTPRLINEMKSPINFSNQNTLPNPKYEDLFTAQSECHYEVPLIRFEKDEDINDQDPYEEPIINNNDSLTFESYVCDDEDNDSCQYEVPFKKI